MANCEVLTPIDFDNRVPTYPSIFFDHIISGSDQREASTRLICPVNVGGDQSMYRSFQFYSHTVDHFSKNFSNLAPSNVLVDGKQFSTVEEAFQYMKLCDEASKKFYQALLCLHVKKPKSIDYVKFGQGRLNLSNADMKTVLEFCAMEFGVTECKLSKKESLTQEMIDKFVAELGCSFKLVKGSDWKMEGRPALAPDWEEKKFGKVLDLLRQKFAAGVLRDYLLSTEDSVVIEHYENDANWADGGDGSGMNFLGKLLMIVREEMKTSHKKEIDEVMMKTPMKELFPGLYRDGDLDSRYSF